MVHGDPTAHDFAGRGKLAAGDIATDIATTAVRAGGGADQIRRERGRFSQIAHPRFRTSTPAKFSFPIEGKPGLEPCQSLGGKDTKGKKIEPTGIRLPETYGKGEFPITASNAARKVSYHLRRPKKQKY